MEKIKNEAGQIRLNKFISNSGYCSRREADKFIMMGLVKVNGKLITQMGYKINPNDKVICDERKIISEKSVYILLNKPKGYFSSDTNGKYKKNVLELIKSQKSKKIQPIGKMDRTSLGLLLLTNDMNIIKKLNSNSHKINKIIEVELDKNISKKHIDLIKSDKSIVKSNNFNIEDINHIKDEPKRKIGIKIRFENYKMLKEVFKKLGYKIIYSDRVVFAHLTKKDLPRGNWRYLNSKEINFLKMI